MEGNDKRTVPKKQRGLWHESFYEFTEPCSEEFERRVEYELSRRPRRADMMLVRRQGATGRAARPLRGLWPRLGRVTLLEFKSPVRGFRRGDLYRLMSYASQHCERAWKDLGDSRELTLALVTPRPSGAFQQELAFMHWDLEPLGGGYARIHGTMYTTFVAFTNEVAEDDDFLRVFSEHSIKTQEAWRWLEQFLLEKKTMTPELEKRGAGEKARRQPAPRNRAGVLQA